MPVTVPLRVLHVAALYVLCSQGCGTLLYFFSCCIAQQSANCTAIRPIG